MANQMSFADYARSPAGRRQLLRWAGGGAASFTAAFAVVAWATGASVPVFFWPFIAGGGAIIGLRFWLWKWQASRQQNRQ